MRWWRKSWGYPHALVLMLTGVVVLAVVFASVTSAAAFGSYNPAWDGASQLRDVAETTGTDTRILTNASAYDTAEPDGTVAVVLSPDESYSAVERARVRTFVRDGGTLLVAEDFGSTGNALLTGVGSAVRVDGRTLRDEQAYYRSPALPVVSDVAAHPLTTGVDQVTLNRGTAIVPANRSTVGEANVTVLANSSKFSYLDTNGNAGLDEEERLRARPVVTVEQVGEGRVVVVSDPSAFINAMLERSGNRRLATNVFAAHDRLLLDYSHAADQPPLAAALLTLRSSALLTALVGLVAVTVVGIWIRLPETASSVGTVGQPVRRDAGNLDDPVAASVTERRRDRNDTRLRRVMAAILRRRNEDEKNE